jgi:hypothetical protein
MGTRKVIDFDRLIDTYDNDLKFVCEMLTEFSDETLIPSLKVMAESMETSNWRKFRDAAHKIKGSSSYMCAD